MVRRISYPALRFEVEIESSISVGLILAVIECGHFTIPVTLQWSS